MPVRRPVAESTVVQVLFIDTFTHFGFYPAVSERSLSTAVPVEYRNSSLPVVKMGDFEFDTDLLISLVEARPVLWDKKNGIYKGRNEPKKAWREVCICLQEELENLGDVKKKKLLVSIAIIY